MFQKYGYLSCIELILTNYPKYCQNYNAHETGITDFHTLAFTVLKTYFEKQKSIRYRHHKKFDNNRIRNDLIRGYLLTKLDLTMQVNLQ